MCSVNTVCQIEIGCRSIRDLAMLVRLRSWLGLGLRLLFRQGIWFGLRSWSVQGFELLFVRVRMLSLAFVSYTAPMLRSKSSMCAYSVFFSRIRAGLLDVDGCLSYLRDKRDDTAEWLMHVKAELVRFRKAPDFVWVPLGGACEI